MEGTVRINIRVRKYLWEEFVHDVCFILYATIIISNALCKRFFHRSLRQIYGFVRDIGDSAEQTIKKGLIILIVTLVGLLSLAFVGLISGLFIFEKLGWL